MYDTYITEIDGKWYAFGMEASKYRVYSIGADCPINGVWTANANDNGIKYVASPSPNRKAAYAKAKRNGWYCGEI